MKFMKSRYAIDSLSNKKYGLIIWENFRLIQRVLKIEIKSRIGNPVRNIDEATKT